MLWRAAAEVNEKIGGKQLFESGQQRRNRRVVAESLADVDESIHIPRPEDKAPAELERVLLDAGLPETCGLRLLASLGVVSAEEMEDVCSLEF
jgi:hypothetical protein